jgi:hypothetical protein
MEMEFDDLVYEAIKRTYPIIEKAIEESHWPACSQVVRV